MAIEYFHIKERDFDIVKQIAEIEADSYEGDSALSLFNLIAMLRHARVYVAWEDEMVVGYVFFMRNFDNQDKAFLHSINIVDIDAYPNLGVSMLNVAFSDMAASGIKVVEVNTDPTNHNAIKKYKDQLGFVPSDKIDSDIFEEGSVLIMKKEI